MVARLDITGERYGRLVAVERVPLPKGDRHTKWRFKCDCGAETVSYLDTVRAGTTQSCGCRRIEATRARSLTHGHSVDRKPSPELKAWLHAKSRCFNPNDPKYPAYGARGITMCREWAMNAAAFLEHMGPRPEGMTLDRIDVNGHYEPGNCRWAIHKTQNNNRRDTLWVECRDGRRISMKDFAAEQGIPYKILWVWVRKKGYGVHTAARQLARKYRG